MSGICGDNVPEQLVDDGAPYSCTGIVKLFKLTKNIMRGWNQLIANEVAIFHHIIYWQYRNGDHTNEKSVILGCVNLSWLSDWGTAINIRYLIVAGSWQSVIGGNLPGKYIINHMHVLFIELSLVK